MKDGHWHIVIHNVSQLYTVRMHFFLFTYLFPAFEYQICLNLVASLIKQSEYFVVMITAANIPQH